MGGRADETDKGGKITVFVHLTIKILNKAQINTKMLASPVWYTITSVAINSRSGPFQS